MIRKTILGLFSILVITSALSPVYAEIMSPLQQLNDGVENNMIQCNTDKILMESKSGKPSCVYETTAEKLVNRGWTVILSEINMIDKISEMDIKDSVVLDTKIISEDSNADDISDKRIITHSTKPTENFISSTYPQFGYPTVIYDYPEQLKIGEIGTMSFNYTFVNASQYVDRFPDSFEIGVHLSFPSGVEILDDEFENYDSRSYTVAKGKPHEYQVFKILKLIQSNPTTWQTHEIQFRVNEDVNEYKPLLRSSVYGMSINKWIETKNGIATFLDYNPYAVTGNSDELEKKYQNKIVHRGAVESHPIDEDLMMEEHESYADFLRQAILPTTSNMTEFLLTQTHTKDFIDELFKLHPDLNVQGMGGVTGQTTPTFFIF